MTFTPKRFTAEEIKKIEPQWRLNTSPVFHQETILDQKYVYVWDRALKTVDIYKWVGFALELITSYKAKRNSREKDT